MSRSWPKYGDNPDKYREVKWKERTADIAEPALHIAQQGKHKICPMCQGKGKRRYLHGIGIRECNLCDGTGKLRA